MSNDLIRRGIQLGCHVEGNDVEDADLFLFNLRGEFALHPPELQKLTKVKQRPK